MAEKGRRRTEQQRRAQRWSVEWRRNGHGGVTEDWGFLYAARGGVLTGCLGRAPAGHMGRPSCLDGPHSSGCAVPGLAGLGGRPGMARIGPCVGTTHISSCHAKFIVLRAGPLNPAPDGQIANSKCPSKIVLKKFSHFKKIGIAWT
jgi:hypothetical protein